MFSDTTNLKTDKKIPPTEKKAKVAETLKPSLQEKSNEKEADPPAKDEDEGEDPEKARLFTETCFFYILS